jgi:tRNA(fMet)-specific endonuclease VapC
VSASYLLDTNVLSELVRKEPAPGVVQRLDELPSDRVATSCICAMELRYGAARHPDGQRLWDRIKRDVLTRIRVLPLTEAAGLRAGELLAELADRGKPIGIEDVLIAATALSNGLVMVTRNLKHYKRIPALRVEAW